MSPNGAPDEDQCEHSRERDAVAHGPEEQLVGIRRPTLAEVERRYIASTLQHVHGSQTDAARLLGISRKALCEKRKRYGLE